MPVLGKAGCLEFGWPVCRIRTRLAAHAPSPESDTGNHGCALRTGKQRKLVAIYSETETWINGGAGAEVLRRGGASAPKVWLYS